MHAQWSDIASADRVVQPVFYSQNSTYSLIPERMHADSEHSHHNNIIISNTIWT